MQIHKLRMHSYRSAKAQDGTCAYERDSVCFDTPQYNYYLLTAILFAHTTIMGKAHCSRFGGSPGSLYF